MPSRSGVGGARRPALKSWSLGDFDLGRLFDRLVKYKIEQGASALAHAIIADGGADVMLSTPVARVEQRKGGAIVTTTSGAQYSGRWSVRCRPVPEGAGGREAGQRDAVHRHAE
ncbi:hypothetical protein DIE07_00965 [Burkholderia sp. Bp9002]|nr:hypothetical protein DIE07_00965 [Burkholderia sp. Bp9002]